MPEETVLDQPTTSAPEAPPSAPPTERSVSEPVAEPAQRSYQDRADSLKGDARTYYKYSGDLEGAETGAFERDERGRFVKSKKSSDATAESSTATKPGTKDVQTEAASGTAEPKKPREDRDWSALRKKTSELERENIALKAKLEVHERAGSGKSAPAETKVETKPLPSAKDDPRPDPPDIEEFTDPKAYRAAQKEWKQKDTEWLDRESDRKLNEYQVKQAKQKAAQAWNSQIEAAKKKYSDYEDVVTKSNFPVSYVTTGELLSSDNGIELLYQLGKNPDVAQKILELTAMSGEDRFKTFDEFIQAIHANAQLAILYGEKRALVRAELAKLIPAKPSAPKEQPQRKPLKEIVRSSPRPSAEVNVEENTGPVGDPVARAIQTARETGDNREYKRLMNDRDMAARRHQSTPTR